MSTRIGLISLAVAAAIHGVANAALTITPEGSALGLSLRTFATGFPTVTYSSTNIMGPTGIAFPSTGGVLVADVTGRVRRFATGRNNQTASSATIGSNFGSAYAVSCWGMASVGNSNYVARASSLIEVDDAGAFKETILTGFADSRGLAADPRNGSLWLAASGTTIWNIDPIAKTKTSFKTGLSGADGITLSPDGQTVYVAVGSGASTVKGFNTTTGAEVFNSGPVTIGTTTPFVDGLAVGTGTFANKLYANLFTGQVVQIDLATNAQTVIASGGDRGDFVTVDPLNNTLMITQRSSVYRLVGASFTNPPLIPGDANRDRVVNFSDLLLLAANYNKTTGGYWGIGDFNTDDAINFDDLLLLAANYNSSGLAAPNGQPWSGALALVPSSVPEPAALAAVAVGSSTLSRRRRTRTKP